MKASRHDHLDQRNIRGREDIRRIETDEVEPQALQWRLDHISSFDEAKSWLVPSADLVLNTTNLTPADVAAKVAAAANVALFPS